MRILIIVGILIVLGSVCMLISLEYDKQKKFEESLLKPPTPIEKVTKGTSEPIPQDNKTDTVQTGRVDADIDTEDIKGPNANTESEVAQKPPELIPATVPSEPAYEEEATEATDSAEEYSQAEIQAIFNKAFDFPVTDVDKTYIQLSDILTARFGDDSDISSFLSTWKALNAVMELASTAEYQGNREEDINSFLQQLPALVMDDMVEISIRLFNPSASEAEQLRAMAAEFRMAIDSIAIATEVKPFIEEAVRLGDLTLEEGAAFINEVSG